MRFLAGFLTLIAIALTVIVFQKREQPKESSSAVVTTQAPKKNPSSLRLLLSAPLPGQSAMQSSLSEACIRLEQELFKIKASDLGDPSKVDALPSSAGCVPANPKIAKILKYYSVKCGKPFMDKTEGREDCALAGLMLRSTLASIARGDRPVKEMTDIRELADRLVASFGDFMTDLTPRGLQEMAEISDRMLELDGSLFPAAKAGTMAAMLRNALAKEAIGKGQTGTEPPNWGELEKRVERIEELDPADPDLDALHRIVETEGMDPERVKRDSLTRLSRNPSDWREHQILAWANWKMGRRDEAKSELGQALQIRPGDPELRANWATVNRADARPDDFKVSFKIGIGLADLLR